LSIVNFIDCNQCLAISGSNEREFVVKVYKKHECCYNVDFTRGRKALCDTRCNTFLRSVLLCAYTDYYDHCDYYDDGNFFHNSPLLHSLVSTMQLWCYYIINTIVWLLPFLRSCFAMIRIHTHSHVYTYIHTHTHTYTHMQKTNQRSSFQTIDMYNTNSINIQYVHVESVSLLVVTRGFFILKTLLRLSSSFRWRKL